MILGDPLFLLLLLPLLGLVALAARRRRPSLDGGSLHVLGALPSSWRTRTAWLPAAAALFAAALLIVALARPLKGREESRVYTEGIDIVLVVDTSSSMLMHGLQNDESSLESVKDVVTAFVKGRDGDRVGLLTFANYPRTECPLTLDMPALAERVAGVQCVRPDSEEDGTAIGVALGQAARKLRDSDARSKVVVLLTDGQENRYTVDPLQAAALCKDLGIKVYAIAAGPDRTSILSPPLDTSMLETVASTTGGRFYRVRDSEVLRDVYGEIDKLERTRRQDVRYTDYDDLYAWLLVPAIGLLLIELLLRRGPHLEFAS